MSDLPIEQQYVLHAAATKMTLMELLQDWQPWLPELEWRDMRPHVPRLAQAIVELVDQGLVEVFCGWLGGGSGLVPTGEVPDVVRDPDSWFREYGPTPMVELVLTEIAGPVDLPPRRPPLVP